jgi:hypothetical protein
MVFYPPSHSPTREGNWSHCSGYLSITGEVGLELLFWTCQVGSWKWGKVPQDILGWRSDNFFNRSPITLKFGGPKLERESQERESESELSFYTCNLSFYTCKFERGWNSNILIYF